MARFFDKVGYGSTEETVDGVWSDVITERAYSGEVLKTLRSIDSDNKVNDDIRLQNRISIMADAFALENFSNIRYVYWNGSPWAVSSVEVERPRLILSLGGVYNGILAAPGVPDDS